ncbi:MAG TPA: hypothetical protein VJ300_04875 [Thermoplasmata archaeon]|nr:hypothetical protein [Thermoplasmata archaeon]
MSGYSGVASAGVALVLAFLAIGAPVWQWSYTDATGSNREVWSYRLFGVDHVLTNLTSGQTTTTTYAYYDVASQPRMAALFLDAGRWFIYAFLAGFAAAGLSVATSLRKLRGLFAGVAFLAGCGMGLYGNLSVVFAIPGATADLPSPIGQPIGDFSGAYTIQGSAEALAWGPLLGWFLYLIMSLVMAWGASEVWHVRVKQPVRKPAEPRPIQARVQETSTPPPPAVDLTPDRLEPAIDEVFVIAPSGLLVKHMSRTMMSDKDRDVVGGMISVVSNFVRDAFTEKDGQVQEIQLGGHRFIMYNEDNLVIAVMAGKGTTEDILHRLKHLSSLLKDRYGERLMTWDGEPLEGIEDEITVLWEPFFVPPPPAD